MNLDLCDQSQYISTEIHTRNFNRKTIQNGGRVEFRYEVNKLSINLNLTQGTYREICGLMCKMSDDAPGAPVNS